MERATVASLLSHDFEFLVADVIPKPKFRGTCMTMSFPAQTNLQERAWEPFENNPMHRVMQYTRAEAGQDTSSDCVRPPEVLCQTMDHLANHVLGVEDATPGAIFSKFNYLSNRFRAIRQDWRRQCDDEEMDENRQYWLEFMLRTHCLRFTVCSRTPAHCKKLIAHKKENAEQLQDCIGVLIHHYRKDYDHVVANSSMVATILLFIGLKLNIKVEDRGYWLLTESETAQDGSVLIEPEEAVAAVDLPLVYSELDAMPPQMADMPQIQIVLSILQCLHSRQWLRFFYMCTKHAADLTLFQRSLLFASFSYVRLRAALDLFARRQRIRNGKVEDAVSFFRGTIPVSECKDLLLFQSDAHFLEFIRACGLSLAYDRSTDMMKLQDQSPVTTTQVLESMDKLALPMPPSTSFIDFTPNYFLSGQAEEFNDQGRISQAEEDEGTEEDDADEQFQEDEHEEEDGDGEDFSEENELSGAEEGYDSDEQAGEGQTDNNLTTVHHNYGPLSPVFSDGLETIAYEEYLPSINILGLIQAEEEMELALVDALKKRQLSIGDAGFPDIENDEGSAAQADVGEEGIDLPEVRAARRALEQSSRVSQELKACELYEAYVMNQLEEARRKLFDKWENTSKELQRGVEKLVAGIALTEQSERRLLIEKEERAKKATPTSTVVMVEKKPVEIEPARLTFPTKMPSPPMTEIKNVAVPSVSVRPANDKVALPTPAPGFTPQRAEKIPVAVEPGQVPVTDRLQVRQIVSPTKDSPLPTLVPAGLTPGPEKEQPCSESTTNRPRREERPRQRHRHEGSVSFVPTFSVKLKKSVQQLLLSTCSFSTAAKQLTGPQHQKLTVTMRPMRWIDPIVAALIAGCLKPLMAQKLFEPTAEILLDTSSGVDVVICRSAIAIIGSFPKALEQYKGLPNLSQATAMFLSTAKDSNAYLSFKSGHCIGAGRKNLSLGSVRCRVNVASYVLDRNDWTLAKAFPVFPVLVICDYYGLTLCEALTIVRGFSESHVRGIVFVVFGDSKMTSEIERAAMDMLSPSSLPVREGRFEQMKEDEWASLDESFPRIPIPSGTPRLKSHLPIGTVPIEEVLAAGCDVGQAVVDTVIAVAHRAYQGSTC